MFAPSLTLASTTRLRPTVSNVAQASCAPPFPHAPFLSHHIPSLTIATDHADDAEANRLVWAGSNVMGTLRVLNNLCERMHVAYFFYLNLGGARFVSIGKFLPAFGITLAALFLRAVALLVDAHRTSPNGIRRVEAASAVGRWLLAVSGGVVMLLAAQAALPTAHTLLEGSRIPFDVSLEEASALVVVLGALSVAYTVQRIALRLLAQEGVATGGREWRLESAAILIGTTVVIFSVSLLNIGLGMALAGLTSLPCLFFAPSACGGSGTAKVLAKRVALLALAGSAVAGVAVLGEMAPLQLLVVALRDYAEVGSWAWPAVCCLVLPTMRLLW